MLRLPTLLAAALAAWPLLTTAETAYRPNGELDLALAGGARYLDGRTAVASAGVAAETTRATFDSRWRLGTRAVWSRRGVGGDRAEGLTLQIAQESQHRLRGSTWLRQKVELHPPLRSGEPLRTRLDLGLATAPTRLLRLDVGISQRYEPDLGWRSGELRLLTGMTLKMN